MNYIITIDLKKGEYTVQGCRVFIYSPRYQLPVECLCNAHLRVSAI